MPNLYFLRPVRGVPIDAAPTNPEFLDRRTEVAADVREKMGNIAMRRLGLRRHKLEPYLFGDDDTAWPQGPVDVIHKHDAVGVILDPSFRRYLDDGSSLPGEPITMPAQTSSIIFSARHDRSSDWYATAILTIEEAALHAREPSQPFFVWIEHQG